jgi:hypothetical protein
MAVSSLAMMVGLGLASGAVWAQDAQGNTKLDNNSKIEAQHQSKRATGSETKSEGKTIGGMKAEGGTRMKGLFHSQRMKGETSSQTKAEGNAQMKSETGNRTKAEGGTRMKGEGQNAQTGTGIKSDQKTHMKTEESGSMKKGEGSRAQMKSETGKSGSATSGGRTNSESTTTGQNERSGTSNEKTGSVQNNGGVDVNISGEQRTEIKQVIKTENVEHVEHVTFNVDVGTSIPHSVHLHRLPPKIVKLVPAYDGYEYFVLADGRIVIVDPDSYEIVYILA